MSERRLRPVDPHEPEIPLEARVRWMVQVAVPFDQPYGTPASEEPWYQSEGDPIYEEILRATESAVWDALDTVTVVDKADFQGLKALMQDPSIEAEYEVVESHEALPEDLGMERSPSTYTIDHP